MKDQAIDAVFGQPADEDDRGRFIESFPLLTPFWVFLAATLVWSGWMLLSQVTAGPVYVLAFLPVIPLMLAYTAIIHMLMGATHLLAARVLGSRVEVLALGPVEIYRDGEVDVHLVRTWGDVGHTRIIVPDTPFQSMRCAGFLAFDITLFIVLGLLAVFLQAIMLALGVYPIVVDMLPVAFTRSMVAIIAVVVIVLAVEIIIEIVTRANRGIWACGLVCDRLPSIAELVFSTIRPRDWPTDIVADQAQAKLGRSTKNLSEGLVQAYYHALDAGNVERAGAYLDRAVAGLGPFQRFAHPRVYPELAYYLARHKHNPAAARIRLNQAGKSELRPHVVARAEAAIALAEGRCDEALDKANEALHLVDRHSRPGVAQTEREWLEALIADAGRDIGSRVAEDGMTNPEASTW